MKYTKAIATPPGQPTKRVEMTQAEVDEFLATQKSMQEHAEAQAAARKKAVDGMKASLKTKLGITDAEFDDLVAVIKAS